MLANVSKIPRPLLASCGRRWLSNEPHVESASESGQHGPKPRLPNFQMPNTMDIGSRRIFNEDHDIFRESVRR